MDQQKNARDDVSLSEEKKKLEDEGSVSSTEDILTTKPFKASHFVIENIRFTPKVLEFSDAFEGKQFSETLKIQNIGRNPVLVKIGEPNSFIFQLKRPTNRTKFLPSGACITKTITYTYHNDDLVQRTQLPIYINGFLVDFPIVVKKAEPEIEISPQKLNFEIINVGASAKSITLTIRNIGSRRTKFEVDCGKHLDLVVNPMRGTVRPKQSVNVCVEIMGFCEGEYYRELWIKTTEIPIRVPVLVEVVRPRLEIVSPIGTENFTLINFPPAFKGTQCLNSFVLKNVSNEMTLFVVLAEVNGKLMTLKEAKKCSDSFQMFMMTVEEGLLAPFESRIYNVVFCPKNRPIHKGWHHKECKKKDPKDKTECDHIAFICVEVVYYIERKELDKVQLNSMPSMVAGKRKSVLNDLAGKRKSVLNDLAEKRKSVLNDLAGTQTFGSDERDKTFPGAMTNYFSGKTEDKAMRFCLHGLAVDPDILLQPSVFEFGELALGQTVNKVLRVTNNTIIGVQCKLHKTMNVMTTPESVWLKENASQEFLISLRPRSAGNFKLKMEVQILAQSDVLDGSKSLVTIATYIARINYNAKCSLPDPNLAVGLTKGFGLHKQDSITFKNASKLPYAAMLGLKKGFKPEWMLKEKDQVTNVDNALVALPDDRPRNFHSWPKDKVCRTIFKGFFRYSPPQDLAYTLSPEGLVEKKERRDVWVQYISKNLWQLNHPDLEALNCLESVEPCRPLKFGKFDTRADRDANPSQGINSFLEQTKALTKLPLVSLSPIYLYLLKVEPKLINFGIVAVNTKTEETVVIFNQNPFPVTARFIPGNANVTVDLSQIIVQPFASKTIGVFFQSEEHGRYFGFLNYVIYGAHEFKITISAFVTSKTLFINNKYLYLEFTKYGLKDIFQHNSIFLPMENVLTSPVNYRLTLLDDSTFSTQITEGQIPPRCTILTEIFLKLDAGKSFYTELTLVSESGHTELIKVYCPFKKISVDFVTSSFDMEDIPLNLPTKVKPLIMNACYHDVCFEVLTAHPMPGVVVVPLSGIIRARSFFDMEVIVKVPVVMKFSFQVSLSIHFSNKITLTVTGNVVCPVIKMSPSEVTMRKICEWSFDTFAVCATNVGTTLAELKLDFTTCPEFQVLGAEAEFSLSPGQSKKIVVRFDPTNFARYVFYLPLIINNILGPPMIQEKETEFCSYFISEREREYLNYGEVFASKVMLPCICINSTVTQALLQITPLVVDFRGNNKSEYKKIQIKNVCDGTVLFYISTKGLEETNDCPFELTPIHPNSAAEVKPEAIKVRLQRSEVLSLLAAFKGKSGSSVVDLPVYVKGYSNVLAYNNIRLMGTVETPQIFPKSSEVHFPPMPLGVTCDVVLPLCAENYSNPDMLKCFIWHSVDDDDNEFIEDVIRTKWLTEPHVAGCGTHKFELLITFQSFIPVAVRKYIVLFDSAGEYATVLVSASSDNSSVTVHSLLSTKPTKYKLVRSNTAHLKIKEESPGKAGSKSESKIREQTKLESKTTVDYFLNSLSPEPSYLEIEPVEEGPTLVIQMTKSMNRISQLGVARVNKILQHRKTPSGFKVPASEALRDRVFSPSSSLLASKTAMEAAHQKTFRHDEVSYPSFPHRDNNQWEYFHNVISSVERWIFEVVMRCDQYFLIPQTFQQVMEPVPRYYIEKTKNSKKDVLHFLEEVLGPTAMTNLPQRPVKANKDPLEKAEALRAFFQDILLFLQGKGCFLPHIRPELLMEYDDYDVYIKSNDSEMIFSTESDQEQKRLNLKVKENPSTQTTAKSKVDKEVPKENSSVLFSKDFWGKSFSESAQLDTESEKTEEATNDVIQSEKVVDTPWNFLPRKQFYHKMEVMDKPTFELRCAQAWLDIVIQIFRVFILTKLFKKPNLPQIKVFEMSDKKIMETTYASSVRYYFRKVRGGQIPTVDSLSSNIYSCQERILLGWLNHHLQLQKDSLWKASGKCPFTDRVLNNFDKDLSDCVALISVTASHCPYIVSEFFKDVFARPDTPNKILHNAARLIQSWRTLQLGLTVDISNITNPNPVFMVMLLTHLYEILPSLHPHSCICFSAPLNTEVSRTIQVKNESQQLLVYSAKFLGNNRFFRIKEPNRFEVKPNKSINIAIMYSVRQLGKISATLFLSGHTSSPDFAKHMIFYLEGEPSVIREHEKMSFAAPLYKVICTNIGIKSPYPDSTTYEIWYSTKKPEYSKTRALSLKPWSAIWKAKVSRRLFLNKSELTVQGGVVANLPVTVCCLTRKKRNFWLMFRSEIGDFLIWIEIQTKLSNVLPVVTGCYSENWSQFAVCTCPENPVDKFDVSCPFFVQLMIPMRNEALWNALRKMFLKTLYPQEIQFWNKHFDMDIGLCLILWLLSSEEEEEVVDEFVDVLATRVTFTLQVDPAEKSFISLPGQLQIPDVREDSQIPLGIHLSKTVPENFKFKLIMTAGNKKEIRVMKVCLKPYDSEYPCKARTTIFQP